MQLQTVLTCGTCAKGSYYQDDTCILCPTGYYTSWEHSSYCAICPAGQQSHSGGTDPKTPGATTCTKCLTGFFSNAGEPCEGCPAGYDSGLNLGYHGGVRIGYDNDNAGGLNDHCAECQAGRQWTWGFEGTSQKPHCMQCSPGYYESQTGQIMGTRSGWTNAACTECAAGRYSGTYGATSSTACKSCPAGYKSSAGESECFLCPAGYLAVTTQCETCSSGKYGRLNYIGYHICSQCSTGQFQEATGQTSCKSCSQGKYQNQYGSTGCKGCPIGSYNTQTSATSSTACVICSGVATVGSPTFSGVTVTPSNGGATHCTACPFGYLAVPHTTDPLSYRCQHRL